MTFCWPHQSVSSQLSNLYNFTPHCYFLNKLKLWLRFLLLFLLKLFLLSSYFLETISLLPQNPILPTHGCIHSIFVSLKVSWLKPSSSITLSQFHLNEKLVWYAKVAHSNHRYCLVHDGLIVINHSHEFLILRSRFSTPWYYYLGCTNAEKPISHLRPTRQHERDAATRASMLHPFFFFFRN